MSKQAKQYNVIQTLLDTVSRSKNTQYNSI